MSLKLLPTRVFLIPGVNGRSKENLWNFKELGFLGELRTIQWDSRLDIPKGFQFADPVKLIKAAIGYVRVVQNAEREGESLGEEILSEKSPQGKVVVVAHSMGTRLAASMAKYCARRCSAERRAFPIQQLLLFNGAAPIHPQWNLRDILLDRCDGQGHNFFNPADPVISTLAMLCRLLQGVCLIRAPRSLKLLLKGDSSSSYFSPPIGHCPTTTIPFNYDLSPIQKIDHSVRDLTRYISFDRIRNVFDVKIPSMHSLPTTVDEIVEDLLKSIFDDPFKRPDDYLRPLSSVQIETVKKSTGAFQSADEVVRSICSLARQFQQDSNGGQELEELIGEFSNALERQSQPQSDVLCIR